MLHPLLLVLLLTAATPQNQSSPDLATVLRGLPPDQPIQIEIVHSEQEGSAASASITTNAKEIAQQFQAGAPTLTMDSGSGSGGDQASRLKALGGDESFRLKLALIIMGGLFIAAGIAFYAIPALALVMRRASSICFIVGGCCIAAAFLLDYAIWLIMLALIAGGVYYVIAELKAKKAQDDSTNHNEALKATLQAVVESSAPTQLEIERRLYGDGIRPGTAEAKTGDKATIAKALKADDLPPIAAGVVAAVPMQPAPAPVAVAIAAPPAPVIAVPAVTTTTTTTAPAPAPGVTP